jgi:hypothetical protein
MVDRPPALSPVADYGLPPGVAGPVGRATGFCALDGSAAGLAGCADGSAGVDVAPTALLKCMTGG